MKGTALIFLCLIKWSFTFDILLNSTIFYYPYWLDDIKENENFTVCTDDNSYYPLKMYLNADPQKLMDFSFYDSDDIDVLKKLTLSNFSSPTPIYPSNVHSTFGCFVINHDQASSQPTNVTLFFIRKNVEKQLSGGYENGTVYQAQNWENSLYLPKISFPSSCYVVEKNMCEVYILAPQSSLPAIGVDSIYVNGSSNIVFKSAINQNIFFNTRITGKNNWHWQNLWFYTNVLCLKYSLKNTTILFTSNNQFHAISYVSILKGLITSPEYGGFKATVNSDQLNFNLDGFEYNATITFDIIQMDEKHPLILQDTNLNKNYTITKDFSSFNGSKFDIFYPSASSSILVYFTVMPSNITRETVILNKENSSYAYWLGNFFPGKSLTVCSEISGIKLYVTKFGWRDYYIYESDTGNYDIFIQDLKSSRKSNDNSLYELDLILTKKCITIYREFFSIDYNDYDFGSIFFRLKDPSPEFCNVYQTSWGFLNISNPGEPCKYIVLTSGNIPMSIRNITVTSSYSNETISFLSGINQKPLFSFTKNDAHLWQELGLYTPALSIILPKNTRLSYYGEENYGPRRLFEGQKNVIASPNYNGYLDTQNNATRKMGTNINAGVGSGCSYVKFNLKSFTGPENNVLLEDNMTGNYTYKDLATEKIICGMSIYVDFSDENEFLLEYQFLSSSNTNLPFSIFALVLYIIMLN